MAFNYGLMYQEADNSDKKISVPKPVSQYDVSGTNTGLTIATFIGKTDPFGGALAISRKYKPETKTLKILGASGVTFSEISYKASDGSAKAINGLTETLDTTTYPDRAILKLYNGRGFDVYLRSARLDGTLIYQYSGENGELIHDSLKRDDDIRRNGETVFEIGNEYIIDATQCAKIADYWFKFLGKKKHIYALQIPGMAAWYNVGDWYNLQVGEADTNEYIDAVVECYAVDVERVAGGIGTTTLLLRDVEDSWSKTTLYATRLATGGSPKRRVNRANIVTVASSEYDGTYDWRCDGTADDVQIQAAIDYLSYTFGGGTVQLTNGTYSIDNYISMKNNIKLTGEGPSTILQRQNIDYKYIIYYSGISNVIIENLVLDGHSDTLTYTTDAILLYGPAGSGAADIKVSNVIARNLAVSASVAGLLRAEGIYFARNVIACTASSIECTNTNAAGIASAVGFDGCDQMDGCRALDLTATGNGGTSIASAIGFALCSYSYGALSFTMTASGGATNQGIGYNQCLNITNCGTTNAAANSIGYASCKSVQQCKSTSNASHYGTGATQSYADAGTSNACADTAAGGYNS